MGDVRLYDYPSFDLMMTGPEGPYALAFRSTNDGDGEIDVTICGHGMTWWVTRIEKEDDGKVCLSGMTQGSEDLWNDQFFFMLRVGSGEPTIEYWGDKVLWRTDMSAEIRTLPP